MKCCCGRAAASCPPCSYWLQLEAAASRSSSLCCFDYFFLLLASFPSLPCLLQLPALDPPSLASPLLYCWSSRSRHTQPMKTNPTKPTHSLNVAAATNYLWDYKRQKHEEDRIRTIQLAAKTTKRSNTRHPWIQPIMNEPNESPTTLDLATTTTKTRANFQRRHVQIKTNQPKKTTKILVVKKKRHTHTHTETKTKQSNWTELDLDTTMTQRKGIDHEFLSKGKEREREQQTATRPKRRRKK